MTTESAITKLMYMLGLKYQKTCSKQFLKQSFVEKYRKIKALKNFSNQTIFSLFGLLKKQIREVAEWLKAHAWKACIRQAYRGFESLPLCKYLCVNDLELFSCKNPFFLKLVLRFSTKNLSSFVIFILVITFFLYL